MIFIDNELINGLLCDAGSNIRKRHNMDMRTSTEDSSQRMLNALLPGTDVPIHRHPLSTENVFCLCGRLDEILYDEQGDEIERTQLCPNEGRFGCVIPAGAWHTVEVYEPSVIYESKDGKYGEDGSESFSDFCDHH